MDRRGGHQQAVDLKSSNTTYATVLAMQKTIVQQYNFFSKSSRIPYSRLFLLLRSENQMSAH